MKKSAQIGKQALPLQLSDWVQGEAVTIDQLLGQVILIEVFQLNCPGCFLYSLPQAIDLHQRYAKRGLTVIGLSTFFEDFELNTLSNLKLLIEQNIVIGETKRTLQANKRLIDGRLAYHLPFSVAMDKLIKQEPQTSDNEVETFIKQHVPNFNTHNEYEQLEIKKKVFDYLNARFFTAETFKQYNLQGTPSHIIIDKKGILRACEFGHFSDLEWLITSLLVAD